MNNNEYEQIDLEKRTNLNETISTQVEYATITQLNIEAGTRAENDGLLSNRINNKQDKTDQTLNTTNKTIIGAISELVTNKQSILVDAGINQNIKTINSQSILGTGNLDTSENNLWTISSNTVVLKEPSAILLKNKRIMDVATPSDLTDATNKAYVDDQNALKADKDYVDAQDTTITNLVNLKADKSYVDSQDALKADKDYVDAQYALKADTTYIDSKLVGKQDILVDIGENQNIKTINGQYILGRGDLIVQTPDVTKYYVDTQDADLQRQIDKGYYWKPIDITGARTRNVSVIGNLQFNKVYKIAYTWSENPHSNVTYREYIHLNNTNVDIERYIHSSLIGLLPNVLALSNNGNVGFRIYEAIGVQNTDGFIIAIYVLSKLD